MTAPSQMTTEPFFMIISDVIEGCFCVEGPMTDEAPWKLAARRAREHGRNVQCGPSGPNKDTLAAEYHRAHKLPGVPPGSIIRPRG